MRPRHRQRVIASNLKDAANCAPPKGQTRRMAPAFACRTPESPVGITVKIPTYSFSDSKRVVFMFFLAPLNIWQKPELEIYFYLIPCYFWDACTYIMYRYYVLLKRP